LLPGDRFVLREAGRAETIGGGEVLDVDPRSKASEAQPDRSVDRVIAERGWVTVDELALLTGEKREADVGEWVVDPEALQAAIEDLRTKVDEAGALGLDTATLDAQQKATLDLLAEVVVNGGRATLAEASDPLLAHPYVLALREGGFVPPDPEGVSKDELRELVRRGEVIVEDGVYYAPEVLDDAAKLIAGLLADKPDGVTVSEVRQAMGNTRKHAMPLLTRLDNTGMTRRRDNLRIAGPRFGSYLLGLLLTKHGPKLVVKVEPLQGLLPDRFKLTPVNLTSLEFFHRVDIGQRRHGRVGQEG